jgi:hypothetical protein
MYTALQNVYMPVIVLLHIFNTLMPFNLKLAVYVILEYIHVQQYWDFLKINLLK